MTDLHILFFVINVPRYFVFQLERKIKFLGKFGYFKVKNEPKKGVGGTVHLYHSISYMILKICAKNQAKKRGPFWEIAFLINSYFLGYTL